MSWRSQEGHLVHAYGNDIAFSATARQTAQAAADEMRTLHQTPAKDANLAALDQSA